MKDEYSYLWNGSASSWALLHINANRTEESPQYGIVNVETKQVLLIEDDTLYAQVKEAMMNHGIRIVTPGNGF